MVCGADNMGRTPVSVTLPRNCLDWIDKKVDSRVYANRSHAIEVIVLEAMKNDKGMCEARAFTVSEESSRVRE